MQTCMICQIVSFDLHMCVISDVCLEKKKEEKAEDFGVYKYTVI